MIPTKLPDSAVNQGIFRGSSYDLKEAQLQPDLKTLFQRPDTLHHKRDTLFVITSLFNSQRFRSRYKLYEDFRKMVAESGAQLITVEIAFGDRAFLTHPDDPWCLQLRTWHEIWMKEIAINLGIRLLPDWWKKVAWVDADTHFAAYDWVDNTRHALEHWPIVQMWSQMHDLNTDRELIGSTRSFGDVWISGDRPRKTNHRYPYYIGMGYPGAPGLAWACRREAWDQFGGLIDYCILGAGDWYMAHGFTGQMKRAIQPTMHPRLKEKLLNFEDRVREGRWQERSLLGNLGVVKGLALHYWHGPKVNRRYKTREQILYTNNYNPDRDLKQDWQGLLQLTVQSKPTLRREVQRYFMERNEDA